MPLAAGTGTSGKTGALALKSLAVGGTLIYLPVAGFNPSISRGDDVVALINNSSYACNYVKGIALGSFDIATPLIPAVLNADFHARAFGSVDGDTDAANYFILTNYPDRAGSAGVVYGNVKFGRLQGSVQYSTSGAASAVGVRLSGLIQDPESTATALAAPSSGALACSGIKGFAQTAITGATQVVAVSWDISTGLTATPGKATGANPLYPALVKGLLALALDGTVSLTQYRNAATILCGDGNPGTLTLAFGGVGDGISYTFQLIPMTVGKPSSMGVNYMTSTYRLKSTDGSSSPFQVADL